MGKSLAVELGITVAVLHNRASFLGVRFTGVHERSADVRAAVAEKMRHVVKDEQWRANLSASLKGRRHSQERIQAIVAGVSRSRKQPRSMTKPEQRADRILRFMCSPYTPFTYTGDRKFWLTLPSGKPKNPDFTAPVLKKVVEVFGRYWHRGEDPAHLIEQYRQIGWDCLVLWEDEPITRDILFQFAYPFEFDAELQEDFKCV